METDMRRLTVQLTVLALLSALLSGCFLTKLVSTPMRVVGAGVAGVGAVVSIVPVVGNTADAFIEKGDAFIDTAADTLDEVPL
jgi:hypothetical protein